MPCDAMTSAAGLQYTANSSGPSTEPLGTPTSSLVSGDLTMTDHTTTTVRAQTDEMHCGQKVVARLVSIFEQFLGNLSNCSATSATDYDHTVTILGSDCDLPQFGLKSGRSLGMTGVLGFMLYIYTTGDLCKQFIN